MLFLRIENPSGVVNRGQNILPLAAKACRGAVDCLAGDVFDFATAGVGEDGTGIITVAGADMACYLIIAIKKHGGLPFQVCLCVILQG